MKYINKFSVTFSIAIVLLFNVFALDYKADELNKSLHKANLKIDVLETANTELTVKLRVEEALSLKTYQRLSSSESTIATISSELEKEREQIRFLKNQTIGDKVVIEVKATSKDLSDKVASLYSKVVNVF